MIRKLARYRVAEAWQDQVEVVVRDFVQAIAENEPETRYEAYRLGDGRDFLHLMAFPDKTSERRHQQAPYTSTFVEKVYPNCEKEPSFTDLELVDST